MILDRFCVAADPDPAAAEFHVDSGELNQNADQFYKFLFGCAGLFGKVCRECKHISGQAGDHIVSSTAFADERGVLVIDGLHGFLVAAVNVRVINLGKLEVTFAGFIGIDAI